MSALSIGPGSRLCDVGAGLGGAAQWIATRTGAAVIALEPDQAAASAARRLFPDLAIVGAHALALPVNSGTCDAVTMLGVVSLVTDLTPVLRELTRVVRRRGVWGHGPLSRLGSTAHPSDSPNTFRSLAQLVESIERFGFRVTELAVGDADASARWDDMGRRVDDEIERRHGGAQAFQTWSDDR